MNWEDIDYDWVNNEIDEVKQKDIKYKQQVMELADDIFWNYIKKYPDQQKNLVFWNKEEDCGNDTELGLELYWHIENSLEDKSYNFNNNEDTYFQIN
tara:strand:- start:554 stop:844 length:291 start_codon:yes stop_codon:yes gene_type:complete